jgi:hypothetical protein
MEHVKILQVSGVLVVDAQIVPMSSKHIADFDTFWKSKLITSIEEDRHWEWKRNSIRPSMQTIKDMRLNVSRFLKD